MTSGRQAPIRVPPPPAKMPFWERVTLALADGWLRDFMPISEYRSATLRWKYGNIRQPRRCECGAPGTVTVTHPSGGWMGATDPIWWRCDEHADVPLTVPWSNGKPPLNQDRSNCSWKSRSISTGLVTECGCGTHVGDPLDD